MNNEKRAFTKSFLKDVLVCSLGAYGGPEAHYGVFTDQMVIKKKHLSEEEMIELIALTQILPGPSSTQTITSIGYKKGGPKLALLTLLVWAIPAILIMTALSFALVAFEQFNIDQNILRYIGPMAVGFIVNAALRISQKVVKDYMTLALFIFGAITTYFIRASWVFPLVLLLGGLVSILTSNKENLFNKVTINPPLKYIVLFFVFLLGSLGLALISDFVLVLNFERFYRYGYLVIGGGEVVIPYMLNDLVEVYKTMTLPQFLTGFGMVQAVPGPMFSFAAYAGGMAAQHTSAFTQFLSAIVSGVAIFLPGTLLIFFIFPMWEQLKNMNVIKASLKGIMAVAGGLIAITAVIIFRESGFTWDNLAVVVVTFVLLKTKKIPAPFLVLGVLALGFIL